MTKAEWKEELRKNLGDIFPETKTVMNNFGSEKIGGMNLQVCDIWIDESPYKAVEGFVSNSFMLIEQFDKKDMHIYTLQDSKWKDELCENLINNPEIVIIRDMGIYFIKTASKSQVKTADDSKTREMKDGGADEMIGRLRRILGK